MACHHHHPQQAHHSQNSSYPELNFGPGAKWIKHLTQDRLNTFHGGHYSDVNLSSILFTQRKDSPEYVKLKVYVFFNLGAYVY